MRKVVLVALPAFLCAAFVHAQEAVSLTLEPRGAAGSIGWYAPLQLHLSLMQPVGARKLPPDLRAPLYGLLRFGPLGSPAAASIQVILDESPSGASRLFVDTNGNGDLTDDPPAEWRSSTAANKLTNWNGGAWVRLGTGDGAVNVWLAMYRFDPNDPDRQAYKLVLLYYRDYAYLGTVTLAGKTYKAVLSDENALGDFRGNAVNLSDESSASGVQLLVDLNGNGKFQHPVEQIDVRRPFNIGGITWEIADMTALGDSFRLARSNRVAAERVPPPDLSVGKVFPPFAAKDLDGKDVQFPADFRGKLVVLDFWATWCGPCVADLPYLVKAYKDTAARGVDVLGVSLDDARQEKQLRSFIAEKGMSWREIYDGGGWKAALAQRFLITSIPATFLVDGDTGVIIAAEGNMRGASIAQTIEKALRSRGK